MVLIIHTLKLCLFKLAFIPGRNKGPQSFKKGILLLFIFLCLSASLSAQQNSVNVTVQVLPPYSNKIHDYIGNQQEQIQRFQEQIIVTLQNNNLSSSQEVKLIGSITGNNGMSAQVNSSFQPVRAIVLPPGGMKVLSGAELGEVNRNLREDDINYQGISQSQIMRTGLLPEGNYQVCMQAFDYQTNRPLSPAEPAGCSAPIPVAYPDPPVLAYPFDGMDIQATEPQALNISWAPSPSLGPGIKYRLRIVELNEVHANPYDLMEQTRISYYEEENIETTSLFYDQSKPSFKVGHTYAIRVQAYDPFNELQIKNRGWSEIHLFHYVPKLDHGIELSKSDYINLVPGYVRLVKLGELDISDQGDSDVLNGMAAMEITAPDAVGNPAIFPVKVQNLHVQGNRESPLITNGSVSGALARLPSALSELEGFMEPDRVSWEADRGLVLEGALLGPNQHSYPASGEIQMTEAGVYGTIRTHQEKGKALFNIGREPVQLAIQELKMVMPTREYLADGQLLLFSGSGEVKSCLLQNIDLSGEGIPGQINCRLNQQLSLLAHSQKASLEMNSVRGLLNPDWQQGKLNYDLEAIGQFNIESLEQNSCGINTLISLNSERGVEVQPNGTGCFGSTRTLDMGLVKLLVEELHLDRLAYEPETGLWNFDLSFNAYMQFPVFNNWSSPRMEGVKLNQDGISIARQEWEQTGLRDALTIPWDGFQVNLSSLAVEQIQYPWFEEINGGGPWQLSFRGNIDSFQEGMPGCLGNTEMLLRGSYQEGNGIAAEVEAKELSCRLEFGAGYALDVHGAAGSLRAVYEEGSFQKSGAVQLKTGMLLGTPFNCSGQQARETLDADVRIRSGLLEGSISNFSPACPVGVGPFQATVKQSRINFFHADGRQGADLDAKAELVLKDGTRVAGDFLLDMMSGTFKVLAFNIKDPFVWHVPEEDPVMSFHIQQALINENGFLVDGRNQLQLQQKSIGATFDRLLLDLNQGEVKSGSIIFDEKFAFEAGINPENGALAYTAVAAGEELTLTPALYMELGENIVLDSLGLRTSGAANAHLNIEDQQLGAGFEADFVEDFAFRLYPFSVRQGRCDLNWQDKRIAYIDAGGFNMESGHFTESAIPDRIPLPTEDIAYLQIRENGQLLVELEKQADGTYLMNTREGQPLSLFMPVLDGANPPELSDISLHNVVLKADLSSPSIHSGSITAIVPQQDPRFNLPHLGVPLALREVTFGTDLYNTSLTALFLRGDLHLFGQEIGKDGHFTFFMQSDGRLQGSFDTPLNASLQMVEGSDRVSLQVDQLAGFVDYPMLQAGATDFRFDVSGQLAVNASRNLEGSQPGTAGLAASADITLKMTPGDLQVLNFQPIVNAQAPGLDLGYFELKIREIPSLPQFSYDEENGFRFAAALDLELNVKLSEQESFSIPLNGVEISHLGLEIPAQDISSSSIPGLQLPSFEMQGVEIQPLGLRTQTPTVFNWYQQLSLDISPVFDFALRLPAFQGTGFNPDDGFTFYDVGFQNGILLGSMEPYHHVGNISLPLGPEIEAARLYIEQVSGAFTRLEENGAFSQGINIDIEGKLGDLPGFEPLDPNACLNPGFSLSIVEGQGFEGSINDFVPCHKMYIGPFALQSQQSSLQFVYRNQRQEALMDGSFRLYLRENPSANGLADGDLTVNLLDGSLVNGYVEINQSFPFSLPPTASEPVLDFTINQARLDTAGLLFNGTGSLALGAAQNTVSFNNLLLSLNDFSIKSGEANLGSNLGLQLGLQPIELSMVTAAAARPVEDHLRMNFSGDVLLNRYGIGYDATATAAIRFAGEDYPSLRAEFRNNFALDVGSFSVSRGRAEFYLDEGEQATEALAVLDVNGFNMGGGMVAILPDTLGLPRKDVAYIVLKDSQGNPVVEVTQTDQNGWQLSSQEGSPLSVVFPSLAGEQGAPPQTDVSLDLITDSNYNPISGSVTLLNDVDLHPYLNVPVLLTELSLAAQSNTELEVGVRVDVPATITEDSVGGFLRLNNNGFVQGSLEVGTFTERYHAQLQPQFTHDFSGTISGSSVQGQMVVHLMGVEVLFGNQNAVRLSGTVESDLLADDEGNVQPLFYTASYDNGNWNAGLDAEQLTEGIPMGKIVLQPDPHQPMYIVLSHEEFFFLANGTLSFKELLGEPLDLHVDSLKVGMAIMPQQELIFEMGAAVGTLPDQQISLFDGEAEILLQSPQFAIQGRTIEVSGDGQLDIFDKSISFTDMSINNQDGFAMDNIQTNNIELIEDYAELKSITLSAAQSRMRLEATLDVRIPEPLDASAEATFILTRDESHVVQTQFSGPNFNLEEEYPLGDMASFKLTGVAFDLEEDIWESAIYATGEILIDDAPRIHFGSAHNIRNNPGIAISAGSLQYNATGNENFTLEEGFFDITIMAGMASSDARQFQVVLGGSASVDIDGVDGSLDYEGFTITKDGVTDRGNLSGSGSLSLMGFASLELGQFISKMPEANAAYLEVEVPGESSENPKELQQQVGAGGIEVKLAKVTRYLQFGGSGRDAISLSLGGENPSDEGGGGFKAGVEEVIFYELYDGGGKYLVIKNARMNIGNTLEINAGMEYESDGNGGHMLRALASGQFKAGLGGETGGAEAGLALAGTFSNLNNKLRYGLFVGVAAEPGIPIFPGLVEITGAGGGYFYNPTQKDIDKIIHPQEGALVQAFNYHTVKGEINPDGGVQPASEYKYAAMLYASVGMIGSAGNYAFSGDTFFKLTSQSVYLDARGIVLGLDGNGAAGLALKGGAYFEAALDRFFIDGAIKVDMLVPATMSGDMVLSYFAGADPANGNLIWAIEGDLDATLYYVLKPTGKLIVCPSGMFISAGIKANYFDFDPISLTGEAKGSMWYANEPGFNMPFGAYLSMKVELCLGGCVSPRAKAAFATLNGGGFKLVAGAEGCASFPLLGDCCIHGIASVREKNGSARFSASVGTGGLNSDLFDEAEGMQARFQAMIDEMRDKINAVKDQLENMEPAIPVKTIPTEIIARAGVRYHTNALAPLASMSIKQNAEAVSGSLSPNFNWVYQNILLSNSSSSFPIQRLNDYGSDYNEVQDEYARMEQEIEKSTLFLEAALLRVGKAEAAAYHYKEEANEAFSELLSALAKDPVRHFDSLVVTDGHGRLVSGPSFEIDQATAEEQQGSAENVNMELEKMDEEFRRAIAATESNLEELDDLLSRPLENSQENQSAGNSGNGGVAGLAGVTQFPELSNIQLNSHYNIQDLIANTELAIGLPSLKGVATSLSDAREGIDRYYARLASFNWRKRAWYRYTYNQLLNKENQIVQEVDQLWSHAQNMPEQDVIDNSAERTDLLYMLADTDRSDRSSAVRDHKQSMQSSLANRRDLFKNSARSLWYDMHKIGMDTLIHASNRTITDIRQKHYETKEIIYPSYSDLTDGLDRAYSLKSEILSLLYGLYDKYGLFRENVLGDSLQDSTQLAIGLRKEGIHSSLTPPQITGVHVSSIRSHYYNHTSLSWSMEGHADEVSYQISEFSDTDNISGGDQNSSYQYLTVGKKTTIDLYPYRRLFHRSHTGDESNAYYHTLPYSVGLRVRNKGGIAVLRRARFDVNVGPEGSAPVLDDSQVLAQDHTPPVIRYAVPVYEKAPDQTQVERYWTSDNQRIKIWVAAQDNESDITGFEYAVGSSAGATDVVDWSPLLGEISKTIKNAGHFYGEEEDFVLTEMEGSITALSLEPGTPYYISTRVRNGAGKESSVKTVPEAVVYDPSKPSAPGPVYLAQPLMMFPMAFGNSSFATIFPVSTSAPDFHRYFLNQQELDNAFANAPFPQLNHQWSAASDPQSGIWKYQYLVSTDSVVSQEDFEQEKSWTENLQVQLSPNGREVPAPSAETSYIARFTGSKVDEYQDYYVHVRALNHAKTASDIVTFGPKRPTDPTSPWAPQISIRDTYNKLEIWMTKNSFDPESGLAGYQYALGSSPDAADLRPFPQGSEVDFEYSNYDSYRAGFNGFTWGAPGNTPTENTNPVFTLPKSQLPEGRIYVFIRALNRQGKKSAIAGSGPVFYDQTPPLLPAVSASLSNDQNEVRVTAANVGDPETGIQKIEYKIEGESKHLGPVLNAGWRDFHTADPADKGTKIYEKNIDISVYSPATVSIKIRVTNGAGQQSISTRELTAPDIKARKSNRQSGRY